MATIATHFSPVPTALLRDPTVSPQAKALYAVIRSYADYGKVLGAFPSQATLCLDLGITVNHLKRLRTELQGAGWVRWRLVRNKRGDVRRTDYLCNDLAYQSTHRRVEVPPPVDGGVHPPAGANREPLYQEPRTEKSQKRFSKKPPRVMPKTYTYTPSHNGPAL